MLRFDGFDGRVTVRGVALSNVPLRPSEDGTYPDLSDLPPDGVAVIVSHREGGPAPDLLSDDSPFPLRWEGFQAIPGGLIVGQTQDFRANGMDFTVDLAGRAEAIEGLREVLEDLVASISPTPLAEGERRPSGFLAVPERLVHAAGSGAVVDLEDGPFALIHAPGGYYALDLPSEVPPSSVFSWDEAAREVVWTQGGQVVARYDRAGMPVLEPPGADLAPLEIHPVVRAWDGVHLLLHPDATYGPLPAGMWA